MKITLTIIGFIAAFILRPLAVVYGWGLFVVPLGVTDITFAHALGLSAMMTLFTFQFIKNSATTAQVLMHSIVSSLVSLALMFIYSQFI